MRKHRYFWLQIGHDNLDVFSDVRTEVFFLKKMGSFPDFFWNITDSSRFGNLSAKLVVHRRKNTVTDDSDRLVTLNQIFVHIYNEKSN